MPETKILLSGALGRLGSAIRNIASQSDKYKIVAGVDVAPAAESFPIFASPADVPDDIEIDCIVDCSHHTAVVPLLDYAEKRGLPIVICTTGHTEEETARIRVSAAKIPVFFSRNMSVGINLLIQLAKKAASLLGDDFDIEIIEQHHNKKLDAPSGTALMIADAIADSVSYEPEYTYERQSRREQRKKTEIGIHSVRGGTIVGEHEVIFAGGDEVIKIAHSAASRDVFANGALRAAAYMTGKPSGFYNMESLVDDIKI
ncbi:MAG: 4-hydroxy-tetrahydrodipicolinate reductase [Clostridiales bacterium]|nr:4-hydroxy-tetrahydrodipicolinate reductase [Clostridiales bacterium]